MTIEAQAKGKQSMALSKLHPIAREINARMEKADKAHDQAQDHRLSAALQLASAKEICDKAKIKFEEWCKENIKLAYETARKLLPAGMAEAEKKGAGLLLLNDLRANNAKRNAKSRAKVKAARTAPAHVPTVKTAPHNPIVEAYDVLKAQPKEQQKTFAENLAGRAGLVVVAPSRVLSTNAPQAAWQAFEALDGNERRAFLIKACESIGAKVTLPNDAKPAPVDGGDLLAIPAAFKRSVTPAAPAAPARKRRLAKV